MKEAEAIPVVDENVPSVEVRSEVLVQTGKVCQFFDFGCSTLHPGHKLSDMLCYCNNPPRRSIPLFSRCIMCLLLECNINYICLIT